MTTDGWEAPRGRLQRWARDRASWRRVGAPTDVVIGEAGLAWGAGEDDASERARAEPRKREGDRRAPAGVFTLERVFGIDRALDGVRLPYLPTTPTLRCVDDPTSADYNQIVEASAARPHASAESMRTADAQYSLGLVVGHNRAARPGDGSCIFVHVWRAPGASTPGCTALAHDALLEVVRWLDPAKRPRLVQLPRAVYRARRAQWGLP